MNKRRLVVGNWKMYLDSPEEAKKFASALRKKSRVFSGVETVLAPSFTLIPAVASALKGSHVGVGAQTLSAYEDAKHTGEVSARMLKRAGVCYAIVGHSERRAAGETDGSIHAQLALAAEAGITAIVCVGEQERDQGGAYFSVIEAQIAAAFKNFNKAEAAKVVIAYEPVWAIGKSSEQAIAPQDLREMIIFIKKTLAEVFERKAALRIPILYGGSVEPENAHALISEGDVQGFLVGHASARLDSFVEILKAVRSDSR